jgi:hypothetical protein
MIAQDRKSDENAGIGQALGKFRLIGADSQNRTVDPIITNPTDPLRIK